MYSVGHSLNLYALHYTFANIPLAECILWFVPVILTIAIIIVGTLVNEKAVAAWTKFHMMFTDPKTRQSYSKSDHVIGALNIHKWELKLLNKYVIHYSTLAVYLAPQLAIFLQAYIINHFKQNSTCNCTCTQ